MVVMVFGFAPTSFPGNMMPLWRTKVKSDSCFIDANLLWTVVAASLNEREKDLELIFQPRRRISARLLPRARCWNSASCRAFRRDKCASKKSFPDSLGAFTTTHTAALA